MSAVADAAKALTAALDAVTGLRVYADPGADVRPPAAVLGPPSLVWESVCTDPSGARFLIYVIQQVDERALERLWDLVPLVAEALDAVPDMAVTRADPGSYSSGGTDLPAYLIQVEVSLR